MTTRRNAILKGVERAAELHHELGLHEQLKGGDRPLDVLRVAQDLGLFVLFKPLDGLLGAYLPSTADPGMMVTSRRTLHVQRFTAAHELGHHVLSHRAMSLDTENDIGFVARGSAAGHDSQEIEADAFASEFLLPKWLMAAHARRHHWGRKDLLRPDIAYQLSLRLGVSYAATCWGLAENQFIDRAAAQTLAATPPRSAKQQALPDIVPESWYPDVWVLSEHDRGIHVLGNPDDWLVLALDEHIASGYTWDANSVASIGLSLERDDRAEPSGDRVGSTISRRLIVQGAVHGKLRLEEKRSWDPGQAVLNTFELDLALDGAEPEGLPRVARPMAA